MRSKAVVLIGLAGLFGVSIAFIIGIVVGSSNAQVSIIRDTPAPYCFEDPNPDQFTEQGMTKDAAVSFIEGEGRSWRVASEDGESFALTEDYSDSRINLDLILGLVVGANAW